MGQILSRAKWLQRKKKCRNGKKDPSSKSGHTKSEQPDPCTSPSESPPETQYQPDSKLMEIPLDVIVAIFDLLEVQDAAALSLACKGLQNHLFANARTRFSSADRGGKLKVQTMLEKDLPDGHVYCPFCRIFHTIDEKYRKKRCFENGRIKSSTFATYLPNTKQILALRYIDARAIMNAVLFNRPSTEDQLKRLKHTYVTGKPNNTWQHNIEAKVINQELYLKASTWHRREVKTNGTDRWVYNVCKHVRAHGNYPHFWAHHSEISRVVHFSHSRSSRRAISATCGTCGADWALRVKWIYKDDDNEDEEANTGLRSGWFFNIISWHRLGGLRSPGDPLWAESAGEDRPANRKKDWVEGDSFYFNAHPNCQFAHEVDQLPRARAGDDGLSGPAQTIWGDAEELGGEVAEAASGE